MDELHWIQRYLRSLLLTAVVIILYESGNKLGPKLESSPLLVEKTHELLGLFGFYIVSSASYWFGFFLASTGLFYALRFINSDDYGTD